MPEKTYYLSRFRRFWKSLGPGLITGASDDDPSAIATFSQAGARFGLETLWTAIVSYPILAVLQEMCARIGLVTGMGLAGVVKTWYPRWMLYVLIAVCCPAFLLNIGADISALGEVGNLLVPSIPPLYFSALFAVLLLWLMVKLPAGKLMQVMKLFCLALLAYFAVPFFFRHPAGSILRHSLIPSFRTESSYWLMLIGIVGAILSPYLFFWQTSSEAETITNAKIKRRGKVFFFRTMKTDILTGALFAVLIMYFIILTTGTILHSGKINDVTTIKDAAVALRPLAGSFSYALFSIGIVSTGLIIIPVLSGTISFMLSEAFGWKTGFSNSFREARPFYITIIMAMSLGVGLQLMGFNAVRVLLCTTVWYGIATPLLIGLLLHIGNNRRIMGEACNHRATNIIGILALLLVTVVLSALVYSLLAV